MQIIHLKPGDSLVTVIEKNKYSLEVRYRTHEVAILTFTTNQKNVFCEELKSSTFEQKFISRSSFSVQ